MMSLTIVARLWRDKSGNTYHRADVIVDGRYAGTTPIEYGYDLHYLKSVATMLGVGTEHGLRRHCRDNGIVLHYQDSNVVCKAEL